MKAREFLKVSASILVLSTTLGAGEGASVDAEPAAATLELTGADIYALYTERRIAESKQNVRILSRDPGGSAQLSKFVLRVIDERDEAREPTHGIRFRMRMDVDSPADMRHTKYLIIGKDPGPNDEYVYSPSARRVRRVNLGSTSFLGTDYTFGDFTVGREGDYVHTRMPDEKVQGVDVYVVETVAKEGVEADYRKVIAYVEKEHNVALRTRSFDETEMEVKEMTAPLAQIRAFGDLWVASESTVTDLRQQTSSTMFIEDLDPAPNFNRATFSAGRLTRGK